MNNKEKAGKQNGINAMKGIQNINGRLH